MTTMTAAERRTTQPVPAPRATSTPRKNAPRVNALFMLAAYALVVVSTATAVIDGTAPAEVGPNDPLTYGLLAVSFGFFALALSERRGAQIAVAVFLAVQLAAGVLVQPGAYLVLLAVALHLTLRGLTRPPR